MTRFTTTHRSHCFVSALALAASLASVACGGGAATGKGAAAPSQEGTAAPAPATGEASPAGAQFGIPDAPTNADAASNRPKMNAAAAAAYAAGMDAFKKGDLAGTSLEGLDHPMLETDHAWSFYGFTYPNYLAALGADAQTEIANHSSLDHAMRDAFRKLRRFLMTVHGLSEDEAISLLSVGADFGVTQVVDANWGVHGTIRKNIFRCD